jgi:ABC-type molybdate transport system permease subunit
MDLSFPLTPLGLTLKVAFTSTLLAFLAGVPLAFLVARKKFWGRELLDFPGHAAPGAAPHGHGVLPHRGLGT